jgi:hypothetical protein
MMIVGPLVWKLLRTSYQTAFQTSQQCQLPTGWPTGTRPEQLWGGIDRTPAEQALPTVMKKVVNHALSIGGAGADDEAGQNVARKVRLSEP